MRIFLSQLFLLFVVFITFFPDRSKAFQLTRNLLTPKNFVPVNNEKKKLFSPLKLEMDTVVNFNLSLNNQKETKKLDNSDISISQGLINIKQMDLIQARILSRKGLYPASKKLYKKVIAKYPQSLEVIADYAEVLIENGDYEEAYYEIQKILTKNSSDLRGLRILASLCGRMELHVWSFPVYEELISQYPDDTGIWFDYAIQRQMVGQWQKALYAYERVLENDPNNIYALRGIHSILQDRRPQFKTHFFSNKSSDNTISNEQQYYFKYTLTQELSFGLLFENINIITPDKHYIESETIQKNSFEILYDINPGFKFVGRYIKYQGVGNGTSGYVSLEYRKNSYSELKLSYKANYPWFDPIQAMNSDGSLDTFQVEYSRYLAKEIRLKTLFSQKHYSLNTISNYGERSHFHIGLSKRLWIKPDTNLSISMDQANFKYGSNNKKVPMVLKENVYTLSVYLYHEPCKELLYYLSIGHRWDIQRSLSGFFVNPGINLSLSSQFKINTSYSYSSESTGVTRGSTQSFQMDIKIIF